MLYIDYGRFKEDFILENEEKLPYFLKNILYYFRKFTGQVLEYELDGKNVILISKLNKHTYSKLNKIFKTDVTKRVCLCDYLIENQAFLNYIKDKEIEIFNGKWLFKFLISDIGKYICNMLNLTSEVQEISLIINEPSNFIYEIIKKLSNEFKNINIITKKVRKFEKIEKQIYDETGLTLNVTNNFKKACQKSKIIFNIDFEEKDINKIVFPATAVIVNFEGNIEIKQSNFIGKIIDFYEINLPKKYKKIYSRLNKFNSSILYESFIFKRTSTQNIWNEIKNDKIEILNLEGQNKIVKF